MWGVIARVGVQVLMWLGTASTGWFLSDWFNETKRTEQLDAKPDGVITGTPDFWTKNRVIALLLGVIALFLYIRKSNAEARKKY